MSAVSWTNRKMFFNPAPFAEFSHRSTGVHGLAWEPDIDTLYLLAIISPDPGKGHFRDFIQALKWSYRRIGIIDIWASWLTQVLERYDFQPFSVEINPGEVSEGMRWVKPAAEHQLHRILRPVDDEELVANYQRRTRSGRVTP